MKKEEEFTARDLVIGLRGGVPEKCSFCNEPTPENQLEPEEAGDWVCWSCQERWDAEDKKK